MNSTALDELIQWIDYKTTPLECILKAKELLSKEKKQIMEAVMFKRENEINSVDAEEYYLKNYTIEGQYKNNTLWK